MLLGLPRAAGSTGRVLAYDGATFEGQAFPTQAWDRMGEDRGDHLGEGGAVLLDVDGDGDFDGAWLDDG